MKKNRKEFTKEYMSKALLVIVAIMLVLMFIMVL